MILTTPDPPILIGEVHLSTNLRFLKTHMYTQSVTFSMHGVEYYLEWGVRDEPMNLLDFLERAKKGLTEQPLGILLREDFTWWVGRCRNPRTWKEANLKVRTASGEEI